MASRPPSRLLVSHEVADSVDMALIDISHELRRRVGKSEFNDALAIVALRHLDEMKALLQEPKEAPGEVPPDDQPGTV